MLKVFEMVYSDQKIEPSGIECRPFEEKFIREYKEAYNAAFRPMREALDRKPYDWYSEDSAILEKKKDIYLLTDRDTLIGSVACYGNEIDDLFVAGAFRGEGYGKKLLLWGMNHIREQGFEEMVLHVAEWNGAAVKMYLDVGFTIRQEEEV